MRVATDFRPKFSKIFRGRKNLIFARVYLKLVDNSDCLVVNCIVDLLPARGRDWLNVIGAVKNEYSSALWLQCNFTWFEYLWISGRLSSAEDPVMSSLLMRNSFSRGVGCARPG